MKVGIVSNKQKDPIFKHLMTALQGTQLTFVNGQILSQYDAVIFIHEHSNQTAKEVEQLVLEEKSLIIYISNFDTMSLFYNVIDDPFFVTLDTSFNMTKLMVLIEQHMSWMQKYRNIENKLRKQHVKSLILEAKVLLMKQGMSEQEAHTFIGQEAMNNRKSKIDICKRIIENSLDNYK
jgi:AmiR/NasT family two-component response regulator